MRADNLRRVTGEGMDDSQRQVVERIGETVNFHLEQLINIINGNIAYDNTRTELITIDVTTDANGVPLSQTRFVASIGAIGCVVISAKNQNNSAIFPQSAPFVTFSVVGNGVYQIKHVTGLQANQKYRLILELKPQA